MKVPQDLVNTEKQYPTEYSGFWGGQNKGRQQHMKLDKEDSVAVQKLFLMIQNLILWHNLGVRANVLPDGFWMLERSDDPHQVK